MFAATPKVKKSVDDMLKNNESALSLVAMKLNCIEKLPFEKLANVTRLTLSFNRISLLPAAITSLRQLEILNLFNNHIAQLPAGLCVLRKLRILNVGMNKLDTLPTDIGRFPVLEILDLSYNNLTEHALPETLFDNNTLRALYLSDNNIEFLPSVIDRMKSLQILVLRDNDLLELPVELARLPRLCELHVQNNRLCLLPPELAQLDSGRTNGSGSGGVRCVRLSGNPWHECISDQLAIGVSHVLQFIGSDTYRRLYDQQMMSSVRMAPPPKADKSHKVSLYTV